MTSCLEGLWSKFKFARILSSLENFRSRSESSETLAVNICNSSLIKARAIPESSGLMTFLVISSISSPIAVSLLSSLSNCCILSERVRSVSSINCRSWTVDICAFSLQLQSVRQYGFDSELHLPGDAAEMHDYLCLTITYSAFETFNIFLLPGLVQCHFKTLPPSYFYAIFDLQLTSNAQELFAVFLSFLYEFC